MVCVGEAIALFCRIIHKIMVLLRMVISRADETKAEYFRLEEMISIDCR